MSTLTLSFASALNERTKPLLDGSVSPQGIDLVPIVSDPAETFWRQLRFMEFDICEFSLSSYFIARSRGVDLVAIPAFPSRRFMHTELDCNVAAGIDEPSDLRGKRIGVPEYQQTAALWLRGTLEHDFGVSQYDVDWYMERSEALSHGGATGFRPREGISFQRVPAGETLVSMLAAGELDAAMVRRSLRKDPANLLDRSWRIADADWGQVRPVFTDTIAEGKRFFDAHGFIPVNHTYVIRGELLRKHPWIALNLYMGFAKAKEVAERTLLESIPLSLVFRWEYLEQAHALFGEDPFPYGLEPNRHALETLMRYSHEQGFIPEIVPLESLFAPSTLDVSTTK